MIIFLYGPDAFRLKQGLGQVISSYKKKHISGLNLFSFDLSDNSQRSAFEDALKTTSFFEEAKLIAVRNVFASKETSKWTSKILAEQEIDKNKAVVVAVVEPNAKKDLEKVDKEFHKILVSGSATVREFEFLDGAKLVNWVRSEFSSRNCSIDSEAAKTLIEMTGNESWKLANEIEKLANYKPGGAVTPADVAELVFSRTEPNIFHLVDAVVSKNRTRAYELLYREIKGGRDPHYLLSMMAYGLRSRAYKFTPEEFRKNFGMLSDMDVLAKNGAIDLTDALFDFVVK